MKKHTVQQGEDLEQIAQSHGFKPDTLWNHAVNEGLKRRRNDAHMLNPGDIVDILDVRVKHEKCAAGARHKFEITRKQAFLRLQFLDGEEEPLSGLDFELEMDGDVHFGVTDDGMIEQEIPRTAKQAKVTFPGTGEVYLVKLGHLDSDDSVSGAQHRLANLGFGPGRHDGERWHSCAKRATG